MNAYVERLTLGAALLRVLPRLAREKAGRLWWIDATPAGALAARLLGIPAARLDFRMIDVRDESGLLVRLRISHADVAEVQADMMKEPAFAGWLEETADGSRLPLYLAKAVIASRPLEPNNLWRALYLISVCRWHHRKSGGADEPLLFLERRRFASSVRRYAERQGVRLTDLPTRVNGKALLRRTIGPKAFELLKLARFSGASAALAYALGSRPRPPEEPSQPRLAVEYYGQLNLDAEHLQSNLSFCRGTAVKASDVLMLFGLLKDPLTPARLGELRRHGFDGLAIHPAAASDGSVPLFSPARPPAPELPPAGRDGDRSWMRDLTRDYWNLRAFWSELAASRGVKAFVTWYLGDETHCAISDGLADAGGVTAIYQRSYEPLVMPHLALDADIHFSFSRGASAVNPGSKVRYDVVTGFLSDQLFAPAKIEAERIRAGLAARGARRVVAMFDEGSLDDPRWHTGHDLQRSNYELLLEKVLADPELGLVFKPKHPSTLRRRLGPVAPLLERAVKTGRCAVLEGGPLYASYSPCVAALAADIAVHGHLCGGTAAVEAALAGVPTLLVDQEGWAISPLYRLGPKVVFPNWPAVWAALAEHFSSPGGLPGLGDWSSLLPEMDPFRDGKAAQRMGQFMAWLMDGFREGLPRDAAMARAAERYAQAWGADKIMEVRR